MSEQRIRTGGYRAPGMVVDDEEGYDRELARRSVEPGWHQLVDAAFDLIDVENERLAEAGEPPVRVVQVKPKMGQLRIYIEDPAAQTRLVEEIHALERRSTETCEVCGAHGRAHTELGYWTLCDRHAHDRATERLALEAIARDAQQQPELVGDVEFTKGLDRLLDGADERPREGPDEQSGSSKSRGR